MAHELELGGVENRIEAAFTGTPGWHGLGRVLIGDIPDSQTMLREAGLNWNVSMRPIFADGGISLDGHKATVRDDTNKALGVVSDKYKLVQNREAFDFLDSLMMDNVMRYESAGAIRGGRLVWVLARMPNVDQIAEGDDCNRYVLFSTSHDGSSCLHAIPTSVRVVCANTYRAAVAGIKGIRHIGDMESKLAFARQYISQFDESFTLYRDSARRLAESKLTGDAAKLYIAKLFPEVADKGRAKTIRENKVAAVRANFVNPRQMMPSIRGTWWALFNSVTELIDHNSTFKGEGRQRDENRMISTLDGDGADFKNRAFDLAVNMAGVGSRSIVTV